MLTVLITFALSFCVGFAVIWLLGVPFLLPAVWDIGRRDPVLWFAALFWLPLSIIFLGKDAARFVMARVLFAR